MNRFKFISVALLAMLSSLPFHDAAFTEPGRHSDPVYWLLAMALSLVIVTVIWYNSDESRRRRQEFNTSQFLNHLAASDKNHNLPFSPNRKFIELDLAVRRKDVFALRNLLGPSLQYAIEQIHGKPTYTVRTTVECLHYSIVAQADDAVTIRYRYSDSETDRDCFNEELYRFVRFGNVWKINGIESVSTTDLAYAA